MAGRTARITVDAADFTADRLESLPDAAANPSPAATC
jgi:hypothetical protein